MNQIIHGDCLEKMKELPDGSVDCIVTDPPYGISLQKGYKNAKDLVAGDTGFEVMVFLDEVLEQFKRVLKHDGAVYIFTRFDVMPYWWMKCKRYFKLKNVLVWSKGGGGMGDLQGNYGNDTEMVMFMTLGKHKLRGSRDSQLIKIPKCKPEFHETQKPTELLEYLIEKSSSPGGVVLDPYAGSGSTLVASKRTGRDYIGIELEEEYVKTAQARLESTPSPKTE